MLEYLNNHLPFSLKIDIAKLGKLGKRTVYKIEYYKIMRFPYYVHHPSTYLENIIIFFSNS